MPAAGGPAAGTLGGAAPAAPAEPPAPKPIPIPNIAAGAEAADSTLRTIEDSLAAPAAMSAITAELPAMARDVDAALRASRTAAAGRDPRGRIADVDADWQSLQNRLAGWDRTLTRRAEELETHLNRLAALRQVWQATDRQVRQSDQPRAVGERSAAVLDRIDRVRGRVVDAREGVFALQDRVSRLQARSSEQREALKRAMAAAVGSLLARDAAPLWGGPIGPAPVSVREAIASGLRSGRQEIGHYVSTNPQRFALLAVLMGLILAALRAARWQIHRQTAAEPDLKAAGWLFEHPLAVTVLAAVIVSPWDLPYPPSEVTLLARDAAPLWGGAIGPAPVSVREAIASGLRAGRQEIGHYVSANPQRFALLAVLMGLFLAALRAARWQIHRRTAAEPDLKAAGWLFEHPLAVTVLAAVIVSPWVLPYAPSEVNLLVLLAALVPTIVVLRRVVDAPLAPFLYALLALYALNRLLELLDAVPAIERPLFQLQMLLTTGGLAWLLRNRALARREAGLEAPPSVGWTVRGIVVAIAGFAIALVADLAGFTQLGRFIASATLGALFAAVILYAGVLVVQSLITLAVNLWPMRELAMIRHDGPLIERRAQRVARWAALGLWLVATLDLLALLEPAAGWTRSILAAEMRIGEIAISLGGVLTFVLTIAIALAASRAARFVLDQEIFPRIALPRGIPYALTTILHYLLLVGGVLLAVASTGINLDRFTILASALGVGVGFGLQSIVSNFVSGLILLFERPIKVGDSVDLGTRGGQIQRIGIRASILRTGDGAEVIVPNSMLISGEVVNWTLSDRQRRIEIPIGVAYGNDPERVMGLLTGIARVHPDVLEHPPADTLFAGFGPHSLDFKLGAWTSRFERAGLIRSELCVEIYKVLNREGIEIPYPQSALHLRSVDRKVVSAFREPPEYRPREVP